MSAIRAIQPSRSIAPRRHLRPLPTVNRPKVLSTPRISSASSIYSLVRSLSPQIIIGGVAIVLLNIFLSSLSHSAIYEISQLKKESISLGTQTQILNQEVSSLRSPQNLADSAMALGMVVNSNPVFLSIKKSEVFGTSSPVVGANAPVSNNLIANAVLTTKSNPANFVSSEKNTIQVPVISSVKSDKSAKVKVVLPSDGIPASPTH